MSHAPGCGPEDYLPSATTRAPANFREAWPHAVVGNDLLRSGAFAAAYVGQGWSYATVETSAEGVDFREASAVYYHPDDAGAMDATLAEAGRDKRRLSRYRRQVRADKAIRP